MRKIYSSPRMENIERLVAVMAEHGIATRVTNQRAYDHQSYTRFSYARPGSSDNWPAVWVTYAADHTRARQLMHDIGIEPVAIRYADELAEDRARRSGVRTPSRIAAHVRTLVLALLAIAIALYGARMLAIW